MKVIDFPFPGSLQESSIKEWAALWFGRDNIYHEETWEEKHRQAVEEANKTIINSIAPAPIEIEGEQS